VSFSPGVKWCVLLLLLPVTLGWKVAARSGEVRDVRAKDVAEFLTRQHFIVSEQGQQGQFEGKPVVRASVGACRMLVAQLSAIGWERDAIGRNVSSMDEAFVVFGGKIYREQPTWLTATDFLWSRFQRELGLRVQGTPLLAVIASRSCEAERLPWSELGG
jgi:hypothetical protein